MATSHQIQALKFDIAIPELSKNKAIQNNVIDVFNSQFTAMLQEVFNAYGAGEDIIIESITLELEPIKLEHLQKDLVRQSRELLVGYFEKYKREEKAVKGNLSPQMQSNNIGLHPLLHFLFYGVSSWATVATLSFEKAWGNNLKNADFIKNLLHISWSSNAIKRLVYHLDEALLNETIQKIIPSSVSEIDFQHHLLLDLFDKRLLSKSVSIPSVKQTLWISTFHFLLVKSRSSFSKIDYLKYHLTQLTATYQIDRSELMYQLLLEVTNEKATHKLAQEYVVIIENIQGTRNSNISLELSFDATSIESVQKLLLHPNKSKEDITLLERWVLAPSNSNKIYQLWINSLRENVLEKVVEILAPKDSRFILQYHQEILDEYSINNAAISKESLKKAVWSFTLDYLRYSFSSSFQAKAFVFYHARKIANRNGISYAVFIQNLFLSVRSLSENDVKHHKLLIILETLSQETLKSKNSSPVLTNDNDPRCIRTVEEIMQIPRKVTPREIAALRQWFLDINNRKIIQKYWIDHFKEAHLNHIIAILFSDSKPVVVKSKIALYSLFYSNSLAFQRLFYKNWIAYLHHHSGNINEANFLQFQVKSLLKQFDINETTLLFHYCEFVSKKTSTLNGIDYTIYIQSLLSNIRVLSENSIRYRDLLSKLNALHDVNLSSYRNNTVSITTVRSITVNDIEVILDNPSWTMPLENVEVRRWLLDKNNRETIQKYWIDSLKEFQLIRILEILYFEDKVFIEGSMIAISRLLDNHSSDLKKLLFSHSITYLQQNPTRFSKEAYIKHQVTSVLKHLGIPYIIFQKYYREFLLSKFTANLRPIAYFNILNSLQNEFEDKFTIRRMHQDSKALDVKIVFEYLETGTIKGDHESLNELVLDRRFLSQIDNAIVSRQEELFLFLISRDRLLQIHKSVIGNSRTSGLRNMLLFQANFNKLALLQNLIKKQGVISLKSVDLFLLFYLEEGFLPGWVSKITEDAIKNKAYSRQICAILQRHDWSSHAIDNWVYNISITTKKSALKKWVNNENNHALFCLFDHLFEVYESTKPATKLYSFVYFEKTFWIVFFGIVKTNNSIASVNFMLLFFKEWEQKFKISFINNAKTKQLLTSTLYFPLALFEGEEGLKSKQPNHKNILENNLNPMKQDDHTNSDEKGNEAVVPLTKWLLKNAGLILVHPFLNQLFNYLDYLDDKSQFKNQEMVWRAVYVLHYIATGQVGATDEADLAMSKLLSGMTIGDAIPLDLALSSNEIDYANEVLQVIISRWDKLGNTSNDGLRNTFLTRNGIVEEKNETFNLSIETSGTDILLDFMPWNITVVKLPWIKNIIYTSWR